MRLVLRSAAVATAAAATHRLIGRLMKEWRLSSINPRSTEAPTLNPPRLPGRLTMECRLPFIRECWLAI